jgi:hypothetical protein
MGTAHLGQFEEKARALLDAYTHGTPDALERHYALTWHRRAWPSLREYVQLDLGKRPANPGDDVPLSIDDARLHVALDHGFRSWTTLCETVRQWRADALMAASPVRVQHEHPVGAAAPLIVETRDWAEAFDALANHPDAMLDGNGQVTDDVLAQLAAHPRLAHLEQLHLGGSKAVTDAGLAHLARLPQLRVLDVSSTGITDRGLIVLRELPRLERLALVMTRVTDAGVAHLATATSLARLDLLWTHTGDGALRTAAGLPTLREFVSGNHVTDAGLATLGGSALHNLTLRGPFTNAGMGALRALRTLTQLAVHDCGITGAGIAPLAELPVLHAMECDPTDEWMPFIAALPALRALSAQDTTTSDDGFVALSNSATLERLWLRRCYGLADRGFRALARMPALRNFSGSCKQVSDHALAVLPEFAALRELMPMDVPDAGYRHIGRCTQLEALTLMYCRDTTDAATEHLTTLALRTYFNSYTAITDRTPALLASMESLEEVTFSACNALTDAGVAALARLPRLRTLTASGCSSRRHLPRASHRR